MEFHEVASLFPLMEGAEFNELVEDIHTRGLREAIWTHDGKIIDGRNRYRACQAAGVEPRYREWDGQGSLTAFVVSENLHRRHLTAAQRAAIGVDLLPRFEKEAKDRMAQGGRGGFSVLEGGKEVTQGDDDGAREMSREGMPNLAYLPTGTAREHVARLVGVSHGYLGQAKRVAEKAPAAFEGMRAGTVTMTQAKRISAAPEAEQPALVVAAVARHAAPNGRAQMSGGPRAHRHLNTTEREHFSRVIARSLRALNWPALEALLEFGMDENMTVKTLLRLCREQRRDEEKTAHVQ